MGGNGGAGNGSNENMDRGRSASKGLATEGSGRDAIRLLTSDHRTVDRLLALAQGDSTVVERIRTELDAHATVEEEIFYPAVRDALKEKGREMVDEALEEHNEVREALDELVTMDAEDEDYKDKLREVKEKIEHHVKEEEGEMFPQVREVLSRDQLTELGLEMESRKEELKSELVEV